MWVNSCCRISTVVTLCSRISFSRPTPLTDRWDRLSSSGVAIVLDDPFGIERVAEPYDAISEYWFPKSGYCRFVTSVLPHSGHWVRMPSGGASTASHWLSPGMASNPQFRHSDGRAVDSLIATSSSGLWERSECHEFRFGIVIDVVALVGHSSTYQSRGP